MITLAIDCAASTAAAGVSADGKIYERFTNCGLTHSQTLLPMVDEVMREAGLAPKQLEAVAVTVGPGSFTGVRIGIATAKGIAAGAGIGVKAVSSLAALAANCLGEPEDGIVCPVFDARCGQVYNALFRLRGGKLERLCEDRALTAVCLAEEIKRINEYTVLLGDGCQLCVPLLPEARLAVPEKRYITARGVLAAAADLQPAEAGGIVPVYLRLSQAEREMKNKER